MPATRAQRKLITSAAPSRALDIETRTRRYLITMAIRTVCFLLFLVVPGWWKVVSLAGAALLPAFAVLLANNADHRPPPTLTPDDAPGSLALDGTQVVVGDVEEHV